MPFLVPAITTLVCDSFIIWLNGLGPSEPLHTNDDDLDKILLLPGVGNGTGSSSHSTIISIYNVNYLAPLAGIRLVILIIPLLFHSYTGTAVRYLLMYQLFYSITLLTVVIHMISLALLNPTSMEAIFPNIIRLFTSIMYNNQDDNPESFDYHNNNNETTTTTTTTSGNITSSSSVRFLFETTIDSMLYSNYDDTNTNSYYQHHNHTHRFLLEHIYELRRIWWMLVLSLVAIGCHWILLWHVRSTAPAYNNYFGYRKPSVYFAVRTASSYVTNTNNNNSNTTSNSNTITFGGGGGGSGPRSPDRNSHPFYSFGNHSTGSEQALMYAMNEFVIDMQARLQRAKMEWSSRLEDFGNLIATTSSTGSASYREIANAANNYNSDNNVNGGNNNNNSDSRSTVQRNNSAPLPPIPQPQSFAQQIPITSGGLPVINNTIFSSTVQPFRVLLQLFAYEDVLENRKLDAIFDLDDGETVTFFVPQLLSFLLHGALYSSPLLEEWILEKCRRNVYFAHRCYWFLRAWCLEAPAEVRIESHRHFRTMSNQSFDDSSSNPIAATTTSTTNNGLTPFLDEPAPLLPSASDDEYDHYDDTCGSNTFVIPSPMTSVMKSCHPSNTAGQHVAVIHTINEPHHTLTSSTRNSTIFNGSSNLSLSNLAGNTNANDKFLPEERAMIERLMLRVKECGEEPARRLEFGVINTQPPPLLINRSVSSPTVIGTKRAGRSRGIDDDSESSWEELTTCTERPDQPISPLPNNIGSEVSSQYDENEYSMTAIVNAAESGLIPIHPSTGEPSLEHFKAISSTVPRYGFLPLEKLPTLQPSNISMGVTEYFDKTPRFLDALLFLAENLFLIPREERKETLQYQLRALECELLPSNSIYLPLGGNRVYHSVWRIVAEESIPISTKERVPCIVPLEVVDFSAGTTVQSSRQENNISRDESNNKSIFRAIERLPSTSGVLPQRVSNHEDLDDTYQQSQQYQPTSPQATRSRVFTGDIDLSFDATATESKMLHDWIHGHRQPFRRTSLLDKVTTTVKVPFDKMKIQMREHFMNKKFSQHDKTEEMQPLSSSHYSDPEDEVYVSKATQQSSRSNYLPLENKSKTSDSTYKDIEGGLVITPSVATKPVYSQQEEDSTSGTPSRGVSRMGSEGSLVSLGQWSSPAPNGDTTAVIQDERTKRRRIFNELKRRLDNDSKLPPKPHKRSNSGQLRYGSDHEDDPQDIRKTLTRRPSAQGAKRSAISGSRFSTVSKLPSDGDKPKISRSPPVVFRESWSTKQERIRKKSAFGNHPGWKLLPVLVKANDDLRQEQLACQLIHRMALILALEKVNVWLYPYEIIALTDTGGLIEAVPDTISLDSLKKNGGYKSLKDFFLAHFGEPVSEDMANAKANFVESLAAYSMVSFLLQIKDRHNGNILLDNKGHIVHIDFGFFFLSSPGKNVGFESAPFKLTREFVEVLDGTDSHLFRTYRTLCVKTFIALRRRCMEIILLVEMLKVGNEELPCFRGRPDDAIQQLRERFRLDLNDRACAEYVNSLIDASIENWRTDWYDRYQRYFVGIL